MDPISSKEIPTRPTPDRMTNRAAYSVDHRSGRKPNGRPATRNPRKKALRNLGASEPKGLHKRGIEDWDP